MGKDSIGDYKTAQIYLDSALLLNPESARAFRLKASVSLLQRDIKNAKSYIETSLRINPKDKSSYYVRANTFVVMEQREKALDDYYRILQLDSIDGLAYETIGYMEIDRGNKEKGCMFLEKARSLGYHPENRTGDKFLCQ